MLWFIFFDNGDYPPFFNVSNKLNVVVVVVINRVSVTNAMKLVYEFSVSKSTMRATIILPWKMIKDLILSTLP